MTRVSDMSHPNAQQYPYGDAMTGPQGGKGRKERKGSKHRLPKPLRIVLKALGILVAALAVVVLALLIIPLTETGDRTTVAGSADWMAQLDDDLLITDVVLPGTHDSATRYCELAFVTKCQAQSIAGQLEAGYRYLDIRLGDDGAGNLIFYHGFTKCKTGAFGGNLTLEAVLADCYAFLAAHPTETIVFCVKQEHGDATVAEFQRLLDAQVAAQPEKWLVTGEIPEVGEARGKLVLLRRYDDEAGLGVRAGLPVLWPDQGGHDDVTANVERVDNGGYAVWVQDRYCFGTDDKWAAFEAGMQASADMARSADIRLHFLSTKGTFVQGHPYAFAKQLNPKLAAVPGEMLSGWIVIDFASAPLARHIWQANFV